MTQGQGPGQTLEELLAESRAFAAEAVAEMAGARAEMERALVAERAERQTAEQRRAERARSGELGPEQRRLQERIDMGQTSWDAVLAGEDDSPEATEVRSGIARNAQAFSAELDEAMNAERVAGREDPRVALADSFARLRASVAELREHQIPGEDRGQ